MFQQMAYIIFNLLKKLVSIKLIRYPLQIIVQKITKDGITGLILKGWHINDQKM